jgi:acyl-CoA reductase-like NAD-dependent aldehyde dehydrogenase
MRAQQSRQSAIPPFGGVKGSGFGRNCGMRAIENHTTWKSCVFTHVPFEDWYRNS